MTPDNQEDFFIVTRIKLSGKKKSVYKNSIAVTNVRKPQ